MAGILFIISAPSGSGKSTLVNELRKQVSGVDFSISWTTRAPRGSEENGREYHFTAREEFERMIREGAFLECAEVFGHLYGTARSSLEEARRQGHDLLHHGAAKSHDVFEKSASPVVIGAVGIKLLEIMAGAKRRTVRGEHNRTHRALVRDRRERVAERFQRRLGKAIARLRPVERKDGDIVVILPEQDQ